MPKIAVQFHPIFYKSTERSHFNLQYQQNPIETQVQPTVPCFIQPNLFSQTLSFALTNKVATLNHNNMQL